MKGHFSYNHVVKSCLPGSLFILCFSHRLQPVVMKISPFRTSYRIDLKSQIFITAWSSTCGKLHQKKQLPVRQDRLKNDNAGSTLDSRIIEKYIYCFGIEQTPVFYEKHNL